MRINAKIRNQANAIINRYSGYRLPKEISAMHNELEKIGIEIPMFSAVHETAHDFYYKGEYVENSKFIYNVYEPSTGLKNDYNMYIS